MKRGSGPVPARPRRPRIVLVAAALLPGSGHVLLGLPHRGLVFLFFILVFGWVSLRLVPSEMSFFARHVGGIVVYGLSVLDAYRIARIRAETWPAPGPSMRHGGS